MWHLPVGITAAASEKNLDAGSVPSAYCHIQRIRVAKLQSTGRPSKVAEDRRRACIENVLTTWTVRVIDIHAVDVDNHPDRCTPCQCCFGPPL